MDGYLEHHGVHGQKWGVRRYQNKDGTRTEAGKKHRQAPVEERAKKYFSKPLLIVIDPGDKISVDKVTKFYDTSKDKG